MRRADLKPGDRVFIRLPYEGGAGFATILRMNSDDPRHALVQFDSGNRLANGGRPILTALRNIVRHEYAGETPQTARETERS